MKLKLVLLLSFIGLFMVANSKVDFQNPVELDGELYPLIGPRSVVPPAVAVEQTDNAIILSFAKAAGSLEIAISSGGDVVYSTPLNVTGATQFSIYTGDLESGAYLLEITKPTTHGRVYGDFIIE